ncbi:RES domain-containing protein [Cryobacterium flavum]|nr:RES family NAD+ phosphorylase [Cryobacterium flavum]SDO31976.1 RES domain-containing protein [Cryobacterium flavum]
MLASPALALVEPPHQLWRVEREDPPLRFSQINAVDALLERSGNRFDVAGAGVLYAATSQEGAYAETLAAFRPSASLLAKLQAAGMDAGLPGPGEVPRSWRLDRRLRALTLSNPLPFVDIDAPATHTYLTRNVARILSDIGVNSLDIATVRGPNRFLTRSLAAWLYAQTDEHARPLYSGIRYGSRLGPHECWAVFDGTAVSLIREVTVEADSPALRTVAAAFGLALH